MPKVGFYAVGTLRVSQIRWIVWRLPALPNLGDTGARKRALAEARQLFLEMGARWRVDALELEFPL